MATEQEEYLAAASAAYAASQNGTAPDVQVETPATETTTASTADTTGATETAPAAETVVPAVEVEKPKSFEEYLAERSQGKFKTYEDLERELSQPKSEFYDEEVKHWNELKKKGVKLDAEFFELQSQDFTKIDNPVAILIKDMELLNPEGKGLSKKTIEIEVARKYNLNECAEKDEKGNWVEKDASELTDEAIADKEKMYRDAGLKKQALIDYKNERAFTTAPSEAQLAQQRENQRVAEENWLKTVNDVYEKTTNFSTVIDEKTNELFEYKPSETDRKEVAEIMKSGNIFKSVEYVDDKGNVQINHQKVAEMLLKLKNYDQAVKNAYNDGKAVGVKGFVKNDLKNVDFKPTDSALNNTGGPKTEQEAFAQAYKNKMGIK